MEIILDVARAERELRLVVSRFDKIESYAAVLPIRHSLKWVLPRPSGKWSHVISAFFSGNTGDLREFVGLCL